MCDEHVEAAGPMMKVGEVFDEKIEDATENNEEKVETAGSLSKAVQGDD